ncbi:hypothetical protein [Nostoc sp. S13]|uniref:hypothetical protein n=1 Tax=Nostoc sp. S13 TaxID=3019266 RepID=UPI00341364F6
MSLNKLLPAVGQRSHQDKLCLIHFLLLAVAKEEGCNLESTESTNMGMWSELRVLGVVVPNPQSLILFFQ